MAMDGRISLFDALPDQTRSSEADDVTAQEARWTRLRTGGRIATEADLAALGTVLGRVLTGYDVEEETRERKRGNRVNIHRLGLLMKRSDEVVGAVRKGDTLARALYDNFNDRVLTKLETRCGVAPTYGGGSQDTGRPA